MLLLLKASIVEGFISKANNEYVPLLVGLLHIAFFILMLVVFTKIENNRAESSFSILPSEKSPVGDAYNKILEFLSRRLSKFQVEKKVLIKQIKTDLNELLSITLALRQLNFDLAKMLVQGMLGLQDENEIIPERVFIFNKIHLKSKEPVMPLLGWACGEIAIKTGDLEFIRYTHDAISRFVSWLENNTEKWFKSRIAKEIKRKYLRNADEIETIYEIFMALNYITMRDMAVELEEWSLVKEHESKYVKLKNNILKKVESKKDYIGLPELLSFVAQVVGMDLGKRLVRAMDLSKTKWHPWILYMVLMGFWKYGFHDIVRDVAARFIMGVYETTIKTNTLYSMYTIDGKPFDKATSYDAVVVNTMLIDFLSRKDGNRLMVELDGTHEFSYKPGTSRKYKKAVKLPETQTVPVIFPITPRNSRLEYLHFGRIYLEPNESTSLLTGMYEHCLVVIEGHGTLTVDNVQYELSKHDAIYLPRQKDYNIRSGKQKLVIILFMSESSIDSEVRHIRFSDIINTEFHKIIGGKNGANDVREVYVLLEKNVKACRLAVGITKVNEGNWSSWLPHDHGDHQEEIYYFYGIPGNGWGIQMVYSENEEEFVGRVFNHHAVVIKSGYHPNVVIPRHEMWYVWGIAGLRPLEDRIWHGNIKYQKELDR